MRPMRLTLDSRVLAGAFTVDREPAATWFEGDQRLLAAVGGTANLEPELTGLGRNELGNDLERDTLYADRHRRRGTDGCRIDAEMTAAERIQLWSGLYAQGTVRGGQGRPRQRHYTGPGCCPLARMLVALPAPAQ